MCLINLMMIFHPKRSFRSLQKTFQIWSFRKQARKCGVGLAIGRNVRLNHCRVSVEGNRSGNYIKN